MSTENNGTKRARDNSDFKRVGLENSKSSSQLLKRIRKDSNLNSSEFSRVESDESGLNSPESNRITNDILDILDEPDPVSDCDSAIQDLDSVIKSFEEEILHPSSSPTYFPVIAPEHGEWHMVLGYLLEASDDELGLPPTVSPPAEQPKTKTELVALPTFSSEALGLSEILGFEGELSSYDSFGFGLGEEWKDCLTMTWPIYRSF